MSDKPITAHVIENGDSPYSVTIKVAGHTLLGDEPQSFGGTNLGPAPYDLLLAALGECTAMTVRWLARQKDWPLETVEVNLSHQKRDKKDYFTKTVTICGDELTDEQRQKLLDAAAKCPVHRTLMSDVDIRTSLAS